MQAGTTFDIVTDGIHAAADSKDMCLTGGAPAAREALYTPTPRRVGP